MQSKSKFSRQLLSGVALTGLLATSPFIANAQNASNDEIIVNATKRATSIKDAPISVAVVTGDFIEDYNIVDLTDIQNFVPNLVVQKTFGNWAVRIRGLGSGVSTPSFDSSVSIFNDGMYCGRSRCLETGYLDVGNVEVARGPQGALYGKSTVAGAISIGSARPTEDTSGYIKLGTEIEHGGYLASGAISGSVSDTVRVRLAGKYEDMDGDVENTFLGTDDGARKSFSFRASAEWDITPDVNLWVKYEEGDTQVDGNRIQLVAPGALLNPASGVKPANIETILDDKKHVSTGTGQEEFDDSEQSGFTAHLNANIFNGHTLTVMGGLWELDYENYVDVDGVPESLLNTRLFEDYEQSSIEARLLSPSGQTFEYIFGGLYHTSDTQTRQHSPFHGNFFKAVGVPGFVVDGAYGAVGAQAVGADRNFQRDTDTLAVYCQLAWNPNDRLSIIADARYSEEKQEGQASGDNLIFTDGFTPTLFVNAPFQSKPEFTLKQSRTDESLDLSIRALYKVNDQVNVYAAYSEGSKPGGLIANDGALGEVFMGRVASDPDFLSTYTDLTSVTTADLKNGVEVKQGNGVFDFEDESAKNYEIGTKMVLADGAINFNATAYLMDFKNLQTSVYDPDLLAFLIGNAATARVKGVEIEGRWQASDNLSFTVSGALTDAKFRDYEGAQCTKGADDKLEDPNCIDGQGTLSGRQIERAPKSEFNVGAAWESQINSNLDFTANIDLYHSGGFFVRQDFDPQGYQGDFFKLNGRVGVKSQDGWGVSVIGRNLTDERTIQHAFGVLSEFASVSAGRSIIVELSKEF